MRNGSFLIRVWPPPMRNRSFLIRVWLPPMRNGSFLIRVWLSPISNGSFLILGWASPDQTNRPSCGPWRLARHWQPPDAFQRWPASSAGGEGKGHWLEAAKGGGHQQDSPDADVMASEA